MSSLLVSISEGLASPAVDIWQVLRIAGIIIAALMVILLAIGLLMLINRLQRRITRRQVILELINDGNRSNQFEIMVKGEQPDLHIQMLVNGRTLPPSPVPLFVEKAVEIPSSYQPAVKNTARSAPANTSAVKQTAAKASWLTGTLSEMLTTLASILPRSISRPFWGAEQQLRMAQRTSVNTYRLSGQVDTFTGQTGSTSGPRPIPISQVKTAPPPSQPGTIMVAVPTPWSISPPVLPGQSCLISLQVEPRQLHRSGQYAVEVISRAMGEEQSPIINAVAIFQLKGLHWFWRFLPGFMFVIVLIGTIIMAIQFISM
ncbi:MAG TPA: hypothetical protein PKW33_12315 [Anaerolineaceae bacterium]|nr:hypothetical protein [Anaerolineaceae bacterium]HPN52366.1 hypothetical protein [Anaerolineaceae bacterium]